MIIKDRSNAKRVFFLFSALALFCFSDVSAFQQSGNLLQFKAGNHILGFAPNKAYLASMDHALSVEFLGTKGVMPKADGNVAAGTQTKALPLTNVIYQNLWDGISLTYAATKDGITETIYHVAPGADVSKISLKYNVPVALQKDGTLRFKFDKGYLTESAPIAWQDIDGKRVPVKVAFNVTKDAVSFKVEKYDTKRTLTIDPVYSWHTFYRAAGSGHDYAYGIAKDSSGNIYVTGQSYGWYGPSPYNTAPLNPHVSGYDIFVLKLDSSGTYQWHTFYGGNDFYEDEAHAIAIDNSGNIYVTGWTLNSWTGPAPDNAEPKHAFTSAERQNIFVLKLNSSGAYQWHTFYGSGGTSGDFAYGIAIDSGGNAYVTGYSWATWNGDGDAEPLHVFSGSMDLFVLKLDSSGAYQWHTFYGKIEYARGIALDNSNNVYVAGYNAGGGWNGPAPDNAAPKHAFSGGIDIFILKLNSSGTYQWHTFYGAGSTDRGYGIATDSSNNIYVTGDSDATWKGYAGSCSTGTPPCPLNAFSGSSANLFVLKLDSAGTYQWHTFYGASGDIGKGITLDGRRNIFVTGESNSTWGSPKHPHSSESNADFVVLKLNSSGALQWNTFYGSGAIDESSGIVVDLNNNIFVAGISQATWQGDGGTEPLQGYSDGKDIVVFKLALNTCPDTAVQWGTTHYETTIAAAYAAAASTDSLLAQAINFNGDLTMSQAKNITLRGGYECDFLTNPGYSTLHGLLTIGGTGKVKVEYLIIK